MNLDIKKSLLNVLQNKFEELKIKNKMKENFPFEGSNTLCTLVNVAQEMSILTEITVLDWDDESYIVQLYSTLAVNLNDSSIGELFKATESLNILCPFGAFGTYREEKQLYHKFSVLLENNLDEKQFADKVLKNIKVIFDIISERAPLLSVFITGDIDYKKALEENLF